MCLLKNLPEGTYLVHVRTDSKKKGRPFKFTRFELRVLPELPNGKIIYPSSQLNKKIDQSMLFPNIKGTMPLLPAKLNVIRGDDGELRYAWSPY